MGRETGQAWGTVCDESVDSFSYVYCFGPIPILLEVPHCNQMIVLTGYCVLPLHIGFASCGVDCGD